MVLYISDSYFIYLATAHIGNACRQERWRLSGTRMSQSRRHERLNLSKLVLLANDY